MPKYKRDDKKLIAFKKEMEGMTEEQLKNALLKAKENAGDFDPSFRLGSYPHFAIITNDHRASEFSSAKFHVAIIEGSASIDLRLDMEGLKEWAEYLGECSTQAWSLYNTWWNKRNDQP